MMASRNSYETAFVRDENMQLDFGRHQRHGSVKRLTKNITEASSRNIAAPVNLMHGAYSSAELYQYRRKKKENEIDSAFSKMNTALQRKNANVLIDGFKNRNRLLPKLKGLPALLKKRKEQQLAAAEKRQDGAKSLQPVQRPIPPQPQLHNKEFKASRNSLQRHERPQGGAVQTDAVDYSIGSYASGFPELQ